LNEKLDERSGLTRDSESDSHRTFDLIPVLFSIVRVEVSAGRWSLKDASRVAWASSGCTVTCAPSTGRPSLARLSDPRHPPPAAHKFPAQHFTVGVLYSVLRLTHGIAWLTIGPLQAQRSRFSDSARRGQSPMQLTSNPAGLFSSWLRPGSSAHFVQLLTNSHSFILLSHFLQATPKTVAIRAIDRNEQRI
jgi:hypothetical protein